MPTHTIEPGECLHSLAIKSGFKSADALYNHPANQELKTRRPNPSVLKPGDRVEIPEIQPKEWHCEPGQRHRFQLASRIEVKVSLQRPDGDPIASKPFIAHWSSHQEEGTTGGDGLVSLRVPATQQHVDLRVMLDDRVESTVHTVLEIGHPSTSPQ